MSSRTRQYSPIQMDNHALAGRGRRSPSLGQSLPTTDSWRTETTSGMQSVERTFPKIPVIAKTSQGGSTNSTAVHGQRVELTVRTYPQQQQQPSSSSSSTDSKWEPNSSAARKPPTFGKVQPTSPQLIHQKRQWDAQRDIPRGTVSSVLQGCFPTESPPSITYQSSSRAGNNRRSKPNPEQSGYRLQVNLNPTSTSEASSYPDATTFDPSTFDPSTFDTRGSMESSMGSFHTSTVGGSPRASDRLIPERSSKVKTAAATSFQQSTSSRTFNPRKSQGLDRSSSTDTTTKPPSSWGRRGNMIGGGASRPPTTVESTRSRSRLIEDPSLAKNSSDPVLRSDVEEEVVKRRGPNKDFSGDPWVATTATTNVHDARPFKRTGDFSDDDDYDDDTWDFPSESSTKLFTDEWGGSTARGTVNDDAKKKQGWGDSKDWFGDDWSGMKTAEEKKEGRDRKWDVVYSEDASKNMVGSNSDEDIPVPQSDESSSQDKRAHKRLFDRFRKEPKRKSTGGELKESVRVPNASRGREVSQANSSSSLSSQGDPKRSTPTTGLRKSAIGDQPENIYGPSVQGFEAFNDEEDSSKIPLSSAETPLIFRKQATAVDETATHHTSVSEVTTPSFFKSRKSEPSVKEKDTGPSSQFTVASSVATEKSKDQDVFLRDKIMPTRTGQTSLDPFDVNSPIFAAGDPFSIRTSGVESSAAPEDTTVQSGFQDDPSYDPFFPPPDSPRDLKLSETPDPDIELEEPDTPDPDLDCIDISESTFVPDPELDCIDMSDTSHASDTEQETLGQSRIPLPSQRAPSPKPSLPLFPSKMRSAQRPQAKEETAPTLAAAVVSSKTGKGVKTARFSDESSPSKAVVPPLLENNAEVRTGSQQGLVARYSSPGRQSSSPMSHRLRNKRKLFQKPKTEEVARDDDASETKKPTLTPGKSILKNTAPTKQAEPAKESTQVPRKSILKKTRPAKEAEDPAAGTGDSMSRVPGKFTSKKSTLAKKAEDSGQTERMPESRPPPSYRSRLQRHHRVATTPKKDTAPEDLPTPKKENRSLSSKTPSLQKVQHASSLAATAYKVRSKASRDDDRSVCSTKSVESVDTKNSIASVESNESNTYKETGKLQSLHRRQRKKGIRASSPQPELENVGMYGGLQIVDPMQRAGLRLLSAAIIPIQTEIRRFLARQEALTRMWALIIIQTYVRRFFTQRHFKRLRSALRIQTVYRRYFAESQFNRVIRSATVIQALYRGSVARNNLLYEYCCAIEIQRFVRGYLATIRVYETIYKITLVQSFVRMKLAMEESAYRMSCAIQLQAIARTFLVRRHLTELSKRATVIQSSWRCFAARLNYQFDILDVIIVQSIWRRRSAGRYVARMRQEQRLRAAIVIQTSWRSFICALNYLHLLADVLITQSVVRRWLACKRVIYLRNRYALVIQTAARRYTAMRDFKRYRSALAIQTAARRYAAVRDFQQYRSARVIQSAARRFTAMRDFNQYRAARDIQRIWRAYQACLLFELHVAARDIQRVWRGSVCAMALHKYYAARSIQRAWRGFVCYADFMFTVADVVMVQSLVRRWLASRNVQKVRYARQNSSARAIQRVWRRFSAVRKIQFQWRLYTVRKRQDLAAIVLQRYWRGFVKETEYFVIKYEHEAARIIQCCWRRFWSFSNFIIAIDSVIRMQAAVRGHLQRRQFALHYWSVIAIQTACRSFLARRAFEQKATVFELIRGGADIRNSEQRAAASIQSFVRGHQARHAIGLFLSARRIQKVWRGFAPKRDFVMFKSARQIQTCWRSKKAAYGYKIDRSAVRIQTFWRCRSLSSVYNQYRAATRIQNAWRSMKARTALRILRGEMLAATLIQSAWRGFVCFTDYIFTVSDVLTSQKIARSFLAKQRYRRELAAREIQRCWRGMKGRVLASILFLRVAEYRRTRNAATRIQSVWRGVSAKQEYWLFLGSIVEIQCWMRIGLARKCRRERLNAALKLQAVARGYLARQQKLQRRFILMLVQSANSTGGVTAQNSMDTEKEEVTARKQFKATQKSRDEAARVIQRFFKMVKAEVDRAIRKEKKRRKIKKIARARSKDVDEVMLEEIWQNTITSQHPKHDSIRRAEEAAAFELRKSQKSSRSSSATRSTNSDSSSRGRSRRSESLGGGSTSGRSGRSSSRSRQERSSSRSGRERSSSRSTRERRSLESPPPHLVRPPKHSAQGNPPIHLQEAIKRGNGRTVDDDSASVVSGITNPSSVYRPPPSRMSTLSRREMDEDLDLEEAWIDASIKSARERKQANKRSSKSRSRKSGGATPPIPSSSRRKSKSEQA